MSEAIDAALTSLRSMLEADGFALRLRGDPAGTLVAEVHAGPDACADCLVQKDLMRIYLEKALRPVLGEMPRLEILYPADHA